MSETHWNYRGESDFEIPEGSFGFVYKITSTLDGRKYIGRKYLSAAKTTSKRVLLKSGLKVTKKKKSRVESQWHNYMGSCKPLLEEIAKLGKENFKFEILAFATTKGQVNFLECFFQMRANVLGDDSYFNDAIGSGQFRGVKFDEDFKNMLRNFS